MIHTLLVQSYNPIWLNWIVIAKVMILIIDYFIIPLNDLASAILLNDLATAIAHYNFL